MEITAAPIEPYDFVVIGGGSAGYASARTAVDLGLRTAVIDGAEELGGLCILRGCMPSKSLIESANRARAIRHAEEFGIRVSDVQVDAAEVQARKRRLIRDFSDYRAQQLTSGSFDLIRGTATFTGPHALAVRTHSGENFEVSFRTALIASGSEISIPEVPGLAEVGFLTSDDILAADAWAKSYVVLGGGAIALELACFLEGVGCEVTVIQRSDQLLSSCDADVAEALERALQKRAGLTVVTETKLEQFHRNAEGEKVAVYSQRGVTQEATAAEILVALGRKPRVGTLGLEAIGVRTERTGHILCTPDQRTTLPHIFAAGDVCGPHELVHLAIEQGEIAAEHAAASLGKGTRPLRKMDYRLKLLGIFTEPQVATVGLSEREAAAAGRAVKVASYPFDDHGKSMIRGELDGFVKLIADASDGEILGASVVGPEATELIHEIVVALYFRANVEKFLKIPHYHPTLSEIWTYPAEEILFSL